jgi:RHS repeat-associated protein
MATAANTSNDQGPAIRSFQFDQDGMGAIANSVNMFRGDVNLSLPLLTLQGRGGLDVAISALLHSNVQNDIERWNREAPTGIAGLGCALPFDRIERAPGSWGDTEEPDCLLVANDNRTPLLRSATVWELFELSQAFATTLDARKISDALIERFAEEGLALSSATRIEPYVEDGTSGWLLFEPAAERIYRVARGASVLPVSDGGLGYELTSYKFWAIRYYPTFEHWLIVKEDGTQLSYGGGLATATANAIQWGVRWSSNWRGASSLLEGQQRYALAWNLSATVSTWNDRIAYTYEVVEQAVGNGGLAYTKACYPHTIVDVFGRTLQFEYADKEYIPYDPAQPQTARAAREYADPHKAIPNSAPNAYQDRYETKYLSKLHVRDSAGGDLFAIHFRYELKNFTATDPNDPLYGDTVKRVLVGVDQTNASGESLPGLAFTYYADPADPHPGALHTITYPQGGTATYVYASRDLPICAKSLQIPRPDTGTPEAWVPRAWFGSDYAVVAWYNTDSRQLQLSVYTWLGFWYRWSSAAMTFKANLKLASLSVAARSDFFAVTWEADNADRTDLLLFHKRANALGQWQQHETNLSFPALRVALAAGDQFVIAVVPSQDTLYRITWDWASRRWQQESFALAVNCCSAQVSTQRKYYLTARANYSLLLCYDLGAEPGKRHNCLRLSHLDALGQWHDSAPIAPAIDIAQSDGGDTLSWAPGETYAVASFLRSTTSGYNHYGIRIFHWDADYRFTQTYARDDLQAPRNVSYAAAIGGASLVASGSNLFRYNGKDWQHRDLGFAFASSVDNVSWLSVGDDVALMTQNGASQILSTLAVYDPDTDSLNWQSEPRRVAGIDATLPFQKTRYFPTTASDFLTLDRDTFWRGTSANWPSAPGDPIDDPAPDQRIDTTTMQNQSPAFIAYLQYRDVDGKLQPTRTRVVNLENGRSGTLEDFDEQIFRSYNLLGYREGAQSGTAPAGPDSLLTFPLGKSLDQARSITLRRHIRGSVAGNVRAYPVMQVTIDSGFDSVVTSYEYDESTAICDPSGQVVKFFRATRIEGESATANGGTTESIYINGLPTDHASVRAQYRSRLQTTTAALDNLQDNFSVLDGYLQRQNVYDVDGQMVGHQQYDWRVHTQIQTANGQPVPIRGAYVQQLAAVVAQDGVQTRTENEFDASTGQRTRKQVTIYNALGEPELRSDFTLYACQVYPSLRARHCYTAVAQQSSASKVGGGSEQVTAVAVTRWKTWPSRSASTNPAVALQIFDSFDQYAWLGGTGSATFSVWDTAQRPGADWQFQQAVAERSNHGLVVESINATGLPSANLYDRDERYLIANFANASIRSGEAAYLGFEDYEDTSGWVLAPSGKPWSGYVTAALGHSGRRSLQLSQATTGAERFERRFVPSPRISRFLFTAWYRTESGFLVSADSGLSIELIRAGQKIEQIDLPFAETAGRWAYLSQAVELPSASGDITVVVALRNAQAAPAYVDDLRWSPFLTTFSAQVYDTRANVATAALGPNAETSRTLYDGFLRPIGSVGPDENVLNLASQYLSRQSADTFDRIAPNCAIELRGTGSGFYSDFLRDGDLSHWSTAEPQQWQLRDGALWHQGKAAGSIRLSSPSIRRQFGMSVHADPNATLSAPLGLRVGTALAVQWDPQTQLWSLQETLKAKSKKKSTHVAARRAAPQRGRYHEASFIADGASRAFQRDWLLVVAGRVVLFFADGELVLSTICASDIEGEPEIFTGDDVAFSRIAVSDGVQVRLVYSDGAGNPRQEQALIDEQSLVSASVYDDRGRAAVRTKPAQLAPRADIPLLAYRTRFVEHMNWISGVLRGEVADYYAPGGGGPSDDQGYPYQRDRYEASPLGRVVEQGLPGKEFAIVDLDKTTPAQRHTSKTAYGTTTGAGFVGWLPAGEYPVTTYTDADGNQRCEANDKLGAILANGVLIAPSAQTYLTTLTATVSTADEQTVTTYLPNYYDPPAGSTPDAWRVIQRNDMLDRLVEATTPDSGTAERIYDQLNQLRFQRSARGAAEGWFVYTRYDALGRPLESGYLDRAWDRAELQRIANTDPAWPPTPSTWETVNTYDGDGSDARAMSRLITSTTASRTPDAASDKAVRLHYAYDLAGNVVEQIQESLPDGISHPIAYEYDNLQNIRRLRYLADATQAATAEVSYTYDALGRMRTAGDAAQADAYAVYTYNADGSIATQRLRPGQAAATERRLSYNSPGWITGIDSPVFRQQTYYTRAPDGSAGYYNGQVVADVDAVADGAQRTCNYRFDSAQRLTQARGDDATTNADVVTYDANGNFETVPARITAADSLNCVYNGGTDQLINTQNDPVDQFTFNPDGAIVAALPRDLQNLSYGRVSSLTKSVRTSAGQIDFDYDSEGRRAYRRDRQFGITQTSVYGTNDKPLVQIERDADGSVISITRLVYGPQGLIGLHQDGRFWLVLSDRLGSSRAMISDDGSLAGSWSFLPFGGLESESGDASERLEFLFVGQQFDRVLGLYNFNARLYDPAIGRFYGTDPENQFASPYVYGNNNPVGMIDPSGRLAFLALLALSVIAGIVIGAATGAISYGVQTLVTGEKWDWGDFGKAVGIGALAGAVGGAVGFGAGALASAGAVALGYSATSIGVGIVSGAVGGAAGGAAGGASGQLISNAIEGKSNLWEGVGKAAGFGAALGAITGAIGGGWAARARFPSGPTGRGTPGVSALSDAQLENAASLAVLRRGSISYRQLVDLVPEGTPNTWNPSRHIRVGARYDFVSADNTQWTVRYHSAQTNVPQYRSGQIWSAKIEQQPVGQNRPNLLNEYGGFGHAQQAGTQGAARNYQTLVDRAEYSHIPFRFF